MMINAIRERIEQSIKDFNDKTNDRLYLDEIIHNEIGIYPIIKIKCKNDLKECIDREFIFRQYKNTMFYFSIEFFKDRMFCDLKDLMNLIDSSLKD